MAETLDIQALDPHFKDEVAQEPGCEHLLRCFSCGVCTATCPVSEIEPSFSPSRIIRQVLYGLREPLLSSPALWYCARCANCSFQCPQDVRFLDIIQGLRNMARRSGQISEERAAQLARGEELIQELRRRFIAAILSGPKEAEDLKATLIQLASELDINEGKEP
ncbi:MAG: 4Fe-4S dicluster domain-containing protein [Deltaproteobacteria bacterium]|nr:4Fe-4S dicluster domain-containing protein [Deltaproteobacteria bacterium]MBW1952418.1 4Fe-4S dicluster domain-containing protein [Deltaproteobacteria bacterium]MBW1986661.1 4Fe-4S dicluster domain-containing protein [Deltaproteobacteria bacterium]MBW2134869.1 4Fe-4S dicluster domain-containing protein [Deltaproteobacteria bacterium]